MNRPTKHKTKAIVYSCCWQSSGRPCVGGDCILRRVGEWPQAGGIVRNSVGVDTSEGKILLPTDTVYMTLKARI